MDEGVSVLVQIIAVLDALLYMEYYLFNNVPESLADFIEGRAPESVGSMHYLAKVKQADYWYGTAILRGANPLF